MKIIIYLLTVIIFIILNCCKSDSTFETTSEKESPGSNNKFEQFASGILFENQTLHVRIADNSPRYNSILDNSIEGMNGIAVLIHKDQQKNIFNTVGMNLEMTETQPPYGKYKDTWNAPRVAPMHMEQIDSLTVKLVQDAEEASGLNYEIYFKLGAYFIDQTITFWPNIDLTYADAFFASYMNSVQNTSLFLRRPKDSNKPGEWLEVASAGHGGDGEIYARLIDPFGKEWHEFHSDNPLLRQAIQHSQETKKATLEAGFSVYKERKPDHFWFGFVDDYVLIMIFKEPVFGMWMSASGGRAVRCPAWDYTFRSGPQKADEKRSYHVRAVYKKFAGIEDILDEVDRFVKED
ncbi:hypothetical protein ACFLU5_13210 [Bacteroidota bacterium]